MSPRYAAVWFDLDGTLCDTSTDLIPAIRYTLEQHGHPAPDGERIRESISRGSRGMLAAGLGIADSDDPAIDPLIPTFHDRYEAITGEHSPYYDGILEVLARLDQDRVPWGIITNKTARFTDTLIQRKQLDKRIAALICGDTLAVRKPAPDPLLLACQLSQVSPQRCVFIGDSDFDIQAARAAGMAAIACRYGYTPPGEQPEDWRPDAIIDRPEQLHTFLWNV